jgi:hypothetical protein
VKTALIGLLLCGCSGQTTPEWLTLPPPAATNCNTNNVWAHSYTPWLLTTPRVKLVFWGSYWRKNAAGQKESDELSSAWITLANDPRFYSPMAEYGIGSGALSGVYFSNVRVPSGKLTGDYVNQELQSEIDNGVLPSSDSNSVYVIVLPSGTQYKYNVDSGFNGSHGDYNGIAIAIIEFNSDINSMNINISHEIREACTDNDGNGYNGGPGETEIGDFCQGSSDTYVLDGYIIQKVWGQSVCKCIP